MKENYQFLPIGLALSYEAKMKGCYDQVKFQRFHN